MCDTLPSSSANQGWQRCFGSLTRYCHSWHYQAAFATGQGIKRIIYIYARSINCRDYIERSSSFLVCSLWLKKTAFTFGRWCHYAFTETVSWCYAITREWWFCVHFIHAENFSLSTKSNLMHVAPRSEDDLRQLSNCNLWFLFLKETKWLSVLENHDNQPQ